MCKKRVSGRIGMRLQEVVHLGLGNITALFVIVSWVICSEQALDQLVERILWEGAA